MNKNNSAFEEMYREASLKNSMKTGWSSACNITAPACINDDFCVSSSRERNDGILTMAFVDIQPLDNVYSPDAALCNGTLFPNINKPFSGGKFR